jgi:hypothetical protein
LGEGFEAVGEFTVRLSGLGHSRDCLIDKSRHLYNYQARRNENLFTSTALSMPLEIFGKVFSSSVLVVDVARFRSLRYVVRDRGDDVGGAPADYSFPGAPRRRIDRLVWPPPFQPEGAPPLVADLRIEFGVNMVA